MPKIGDYGIANMTAERPGAQLVPHAHADEPPRASRSRCTCGRRSPTATRRRPRSRRCGSTPRAATSTRRSRCPATGRRARTTSTTHTYTVPEDGRIIGAQGHLHGGGKYQTLTNTSCGNRRLMRSQAYYAIPDHIFYRVRPILHEPSPVSMSRTASQEGIPVSGGDQLRLRAVYDNHLPHTRVMSIMMAYLVPGEVEPCARVSRRPREAGRAAPLPEAVPAGDRAADGAAARRVQAVHGSDRRGGLLLHAAARGRGPRAPR